MTKVSLRNRTTERRGRQKDCVWQTWQGYKLRVLRDLHFTLMFFGLLQEDLFKGRWCLAESFFKQNYCHSYHTRFDVFFPLPSCCVISLIIITLWSVFYIYPVRCPWSAVRSPQSAVGGLSFILPDPKRFTPGFTLRRVMLQGYNKSIFINEKTFSLILWKRVGHDTGRLWLPVGVTFPLETAWRRHATRNTPSLQDDRHLVCSRATSAFTLPSRHRYF